MRNKSRGVFAASLIPIIAAGLLLARIARQLKTGVFTAYDSFYVPDAVAGWVPTEKFLSVGWTIYGDPSGWNILLFPLGFLGVAAIGGALLAAAWIAVILENKGRRKTARVAKRAVWAAAILSLAFPIYAFVQPLPPKNAAVMKPVIQIDTGLEKAATLPSVGAGKLSLVTASSNDVSANVKAGGDEFKAAFPKVDGYVQADFADLKAPIDAYFSVATDVVVTGNELRDKHASTHLKSAEFPLVEVRIDEITTSKQISQKEIGIRAIAAVTLAGKVEKVEVQGTVKELTTEEVKHLKIAANGSVVLLQANLEVSIEGTPIDDGETFDSKVLPISISLAMAKSPT